MLPQTAPQLNQHINELASEQISPGVGTTFSAALCYTSIESARYFHSSHRPFLDAQASLAPTQVSPSVRPSFRHTFFNFHSISVSGRST